MTTIILPAARYPIGNFTAKAVSVNLKKEGFPVELVKGKGYFYFVYDDGVKFETFSIWTTRITSMAMSQWIVLGRQFAQGVQNVS